MPQINLQDRITLETDKETIDITPSPIPTLRGNEIIGGKTQASLESPVFVENITKPFQSPNFKQGTTGWRLNSNGILEANGAIIT